MKTIVYQSYRTEGVAPWITTCMGTVKAWAQANGYEYTFIDDSLFDRVPAWYRDKVGGQKCPMADFARLVCARELMAKGYDRTVWVDADVLVFAPESLRVDVTASFAYCHEVWLGLDPQGDPVFYRNINNAVTVFVKGTVYLDFFIDAAGRTVLASDVVTKTSVSTQFLSRLWQILPFHRLMNVGLFSPLLMVDIASDAGLYLPAYGKALPQPLACANLCGSLVGELRQGVVATQETYDTVIAKCLESRGEVVNRFLPASSVAR